MIHDTYEGAAAGALALVVLGALALRSKMRQLTSGIPSSKQTRLLIGLVLALLFVIALTVGLVQVSCLWAELSDRDNLLCGLPRT